MVGEKVVGEKVVVLDGSEDRRPFVKRVLLQLASCESLDCLAGCSPTAAKSNGHKLEWKQRRIDATFRCSQRNTETTANGETHTHISGPCFEDIGS